MADPRRPRVPITVEAEAFENFKRAMRQAADQMRGVTLQMRARRLEREQRRQGAYHDALCEPQEDVFV